MVHKIDPLRDPRWREFLQRQPQASVFHTPAWLEALRRTYGYEPVAFTTSPPGGELQNGLVFCYIDSWLTGRRMVSLPFSDHCEPLVENPEDLRELLYSLEIGLRKSNWGYIEIRPLRVQLGGEVGFAKYNEFCFHVLDLRKGLEDLFGGFHKDSVQRKIRRAEREALMYEEGRSESVLTKFYHLLLQTRRRHCVPPQPFRWFRNLIDCMGDALRIRVVSKDRQPVAGILTLSYKDTVVYKYGGSNVSFNNLGGMHCLLWKTIQDAKSSGCLVLDLGRSDRDNRGLLVFKDRWGASRSTLSYWRYPACLSQTSRESWTMNLTKQIFARLPDSALATAGKLLYRHIG